MPKPQTVLFGKHLPDQPAYGNPGTPFLKNVIPAKGFLRPFADHNPNSDALDARAQGAISGQDNTGNVLTFAGDATKLYKLNGALFSDVSRVAGGVYATGPEAQWEFIQWSDDILIAINGTDDPQKIDPQSGANFEALGGSPPAAAHGAVVRSFVMLGNWAGNENAVQWSAIDNAEEYNTNGVNQSDRAVLPSGGAVQRVLGGEVGIVFARTSIHRFAYVGSPVYFQRDEIGPGIGLIAPGAAAQFGSIIFFVARNGMYHMNALGQTQQIGESRWHKTFFSELDENHLSRVTSAIDPINTIWMVAYPNASANDGLPNRMFLYNWAADDCAFIDIDTEILLQAFTPGTSLDDLTATTGFDLDSLPFSLDSRVWQGGALAAAAFNSEHKLSFFSGPNLQAEIETGERGGTRRLYVSGFRPITDASGAEIAVKSRDVLDMSAVTGAYTTQGPDGLCPAHKEARYVRAAMRIPPGTPWTRAQGVEMMIDDAGEV